MSNTSRPQHTEQPDAARDGPSSSRAGRTLRQLWPGWRYSLFLVGIFVLLVGAATVGSLAYSSSDADASEIAGTWESGGIAPFSTLECPNPSSQFELVSSPVREGSR